MDQATPPKGRKRSQDDCIQDSDSAVLREREEEIFKVASGLNKMDIGRRNILSELQGALTTKQRLDSLSRIRYVLGLEKQVIDSCTAAEEATTKENALSFAVNRELSRDRFSRENRTATAIADAAIYRSLIEGGIISVLILQLNLVLQRHGSTCQEVYELLFVIHHLLRNSPKEVMHIAQEEAQSRQFVDLLASSLKIATVQNDSRRHAKNYSILRVTVSIIHTFSSTSDGAQKLMRCRSLLVQLVESLQNQKEQNFEHELILESLGAWKNLSCYADRASTQTVLIHIPNLLVSLANLVMKYDEETLLERTSAILRNLVLSCSECRVSMGSNSDVLNAVMQLMSVPRSLITISKRQIKIRRRITVNALGVVHSLAMDRSTCLLLILHGDGTILNLLKRLIRHETDDGIRKRAIRAVLLLANDSSANMIVRRSDLMDLLSEKAIRDTSRAVRDEAAGAFAKCAGLVKASQPNYMSVLDGLIQLSKDPTFPPDVLARTLREQASSPENRVRMVDNRAIVEIVTKVALAHDTSADAKEDACCTLSDLAKEEENVARLAEDSVLSALIQNTLGPSNIMTLTQKYAVSTLVRLASEPCNRSSMATKDMLLRVLITCAARITDNSTKSDVKQSILLLVQEL